MDGSAVIKQSMIKSWLMACRAMLLAVLFLPALQAQAQGAWDEAGAVVSEATEQMKLLLADGSLQQQENFQRLFEGVDTVLTPVVDFDRVARGVMAKHYRKASDAQRQRFTEVFKGTLIKTYSKALSVFVINDFKLVPNNKPSKKPNRQRVRVDLVSAGGQHYLLDYFMIKGDQGWKLVNVMLDGINIGQVFKRQFAEALERNGGDIDSVIDQWDALVAPTDSAFAA